MSSRQIWIPHLGLLIALIISVSLAVALVEANTKYKKDISRKSIVFDIKTPKVFYCPQDKQIDETKMIVKSKPLDKLCEFEGKATPKGSPSDCYNDVDETDYACDEKRRFLLRLDSLSDPDQMTTTAVSDSSDFNYILSKKKSIVGGKKV